MRSGLRIWNVVSHNRVSDSRPLDHNPVVRTSPVNHNEQFGETFGKVSTLGQYQIVGAELRNVEYVVADNQSRFDLGGIAICPLNAHMLKSEAEAVAFRYASEKQIAINFVAPLGSGNDGWVWQTNRRSVLKLLERESKYIVELTCYQRLAQADVRDILGFRVPRLVDFSDSCHAIEMTTVVKPYLIDFAKCHLDQPAEFSAEVWREWDENGRDIFGKRRWPIAKKVASSLQQFGIYYYDIQPGNIMFADWTGEGEDDEP